MRHRGSGTKFNTAGPSIRAPEVCPWSGLTLHWGSVRLPWIAAEHADSLNTLLDNPC